VFKLGNPKEFIKNIGLNETELPDPKMYFALKKYHAMMCARVKFRERESIDFSIQGLTEYVDYLSQKIYGKPSEFSRFIDFTQHPARVLPIFREYTELSESELEKICNQRSCSNEDEVLVNLFIEFMQEQAKGMEKKKFIH
jgi:hypothetical protein